VGRCPHSGPQQEVTLPPFEEETPTAWFKSAEVMLNLHSVKDREMWFYFTQWALTNQQKKLVDDIISLDPTPPNAYALLKGRLLGLYDKGARARFAKFRRLSDLGGRRPSELLAEMRAMYPKGEEGSNAFRYEFFLRLPPNIQAMLGEDDSSSATELAARADALMATAVDNTTSVNAVDAEGEVVVVRQDNNSRKRKRFSKRGKDRDAGEAGDAGAMAAPRAAPSHGRSWASATLTTSSGARHTRGTAALAAPGQKTKTPGESQRRHRQDAGPCGVPANGKPLPCGHRGYFQPSAAQVYQDPSKAAEANRPQRPAHQVLRIGGRLFHRISTYNIELHSNVVICHKRGHLESADPAVWAVSRAGKLFVPSRLSAHTAGSADFKWYLFSFIAILYYISSMENSFRQVEFPRFYTKKLSNIRVLYTEIEQ
jgi:hypothetical protein